MNKLKAIAAMCIALCVISVILIPTAVSYQDDEYIAWAIENRESNVFYIKTIREGIEGRDWRIVKAYSDLAFDRYSNALYKIDQFDVSPGYLSKAKDEGKAEYEDMRQAMYYIGKDAESHLSGEGSNEYYVQKSNSYLESAAPHAEKGLEYLEKYLEEIENAPRSIDSDSDGVPDDYDYAPKDPNVQTKEDAKTPGFGAIISIICILVVGYFVIKRRE